MLVQNTRTHMSSGTTAGKACRNLAKTRRIEFGPRSEERLLESIRTRILSHRSVLRRFQAGKQAGLSVA